MRRLLNSRNGDPQREELMDKQQAQQIQADQTSQATSQALDEQRQNLTQNLQELVRTGVPRDRVDAFQDMLSEDMVLSFLTSAETDEMRWLSRLFAELLIADHPRQGSVMQGDYRAVLSDDDDDDLEPMSGREKNQLQQVLMNVLSRMARSRDGQQWEEFGKVYTVNEQRTEDDDERRKLFG